MAKATFLHGDPDFMDYTPSGADVAAGDVVMIGDRPCVAHVPIADGVKGALAYRGGVYRLIKDGSSGPAFSVGEDVAWDDGLEEAVEAANGYGFGWAVNADGSTNVAYVDATHEPNGLAFET